MAVWAASSAGPALKVAQLATDCAPASSLLAGGVDGGEGGGIVDGSDGDGEVAGGGACGTAEVVGGGEADGGCAVGVGGGGVGEGTVGGDPRRDGKGKGAGGGDDGGGKSDGLGGFVGARGGGGETNDGLRACVFVNCWGVGRGERDGGWVVQGVDGDGEGAGLAGVDAAVGGAAVIDDGDTVSGYAVSICGGRKG